jgi:hypothetical protein
MYYPNNTIFEGEWSDGKKNGQGKMYYANNTLYEGNWINDSKQDNGKYHELDDNGNIINSHDINPNKKAKY